MMPANDGDNDDDDDAKKKKKRQDKQTYMDIHEQTPD